MPGNIDMLANMSTVFLSGIHSHERNLIIKYCVANDINAFVIPRVGDTLMSGAHPFHMFHLPMLRLQRYAASPEYLFIKRALDIAFSTIALIVSSPVFVITAIAIKAVDGGPVFYRQRRLTKDGKLFDVLKFRSMRVDAEKDGVARLSTGEMMTALHQSGALSENAALMSCRSLYVFYLVICLLLARVRSGRKSPWSMKRSCRNLHCACRPKQD